MVTDQNHSSDSTPIEQEVSRYEKIAKRIADMDSALSEKMGALDEKMDNYYSEYKKSVKRLERDVGSLEDGLENLDEYVVKDLDECVDRETVVDLIHEIVPSLIGKKGSRGAVLRKSEDIPHKQRRKARPRKVKQIVV
ncbi:hypothetical protein RhiirA5_439115 [Rhizophagus irregularis]|uniref:Uncharacterized protein n=1 Tax=Rhizophagus irregularis TaxID=588596 RepID=A0A2N0NI93_9GLOM|nr:hypothetical protein RhiirA5_439115 [Rhizophagus irregularis]